MSLRDFIMQTVRRLNKTTNPFVNSIIGEYISREPIGLICMTVTEMDQLREQGGTEHCKAILRRIDERVASILSIAACGVIAHRVVSDDLFVLVSFPNSCLNLSTILYNAAEELKSHLVKSLDSIVAVGEKRINFHFGTTVVRPHPDLAIDSLLYKGMIDVLFQAKLSRDTNHREQLAEFMDIVQHGRIRTHYQPIVSLWTGDTFGYEGLSRGPENTPFASPLRLFDFAEREGQLHALEEVALQSAMVHFQPAPAATKLFLNINSSTFTEKDFVVDRLLSILEHRELKPYDVVLEITERSAISDFAQFARILERCRRSGYLIAVDDAGAGYSSLQTIAEVKPDFIKIDRSLVNGIDRDRVKETLVASLCQAAIACNSKVIAEGIETYEELERVAQLGVPYVQGFLLSRPTPNVRPISAGVTAMLQQAMTSVRPPVDVTTIGQIAKDVHTFPAYVEASKVVDFFHTNEHVTGIVVTQNDRPIGLVMREKLFRKLATKYGVSLFWNRSIDEVMDRQPLILDESVSVENSSVLSMGRHVDQLYDLIIVTRNGALHGGVTVQTILNTVTNAQLELARDANPLTGLPGNRRIDLELSRRVSAEQPFSVIYIDLDHFKWFNDAFGFQKGDQAIRCVADVIRRVLTERQLPDIFVGHIGGDDFILFTPSDALSLVQSVRTKFDDEINQQFPLLKNRNWTVRSREGAIIETSGLTLSISILHCEPPFTGVTQETLAAYSGELKRQAKSKGGNRITIGLYNDFNQMDLERV
ncbi:bifunctional diguanylate cyclase/phosphodiesterase [Alicyclobacillus dauci]|uniref:EAL and GGDEF domain-containing protein n=1 Tax=Alicyclobacillus dauci TaxID=1475485 RepID=A0ABY6YYK2_9BACL|nr:bifunctional diguanylate cyclase/phosphodiesterase [Alicyclobacillus dauci]WAH35159.1 EAL and GGDEF domain-containing protein [Alicyclobacillus dauci]